MTRKSLFREEALTERQTQWLGTVLVVPTPSHRLFMWFGVVMATAVVLLLTFGHYARKERIAGWLVPQHGLIQVYAPTAGVVSDVFVKEGGEVQRGERLLVLSTELQSNSLGGTQTEIVQRLSDRRDSLLAEAREVEQLNARRQRSLEDRVAALVAEQEKLQKEIELQKYRVHLARKSEKRQSDLQERGIVSEQALQAATEATVDQRAKWRELERLHIGNERERLALLNELDNLPLTTRSQIAKIRREAAAVEQELAEAEERREIIIPAPATGTVTAVQAERGSRPDTRVPLFSIVPKGSLLEAHLFCPSRAIGFLRAGQRVLLRYQAYPYQKFGHYEAVLTGVSRSAVSPAALPPQLSALTSLVGTGEPVYRLTARLNTQHVTAYGQPVPLQPGMQLEADVIIEQRRLYEWILDPLYTLTGRLNG